MSKDRLVIRGARQHNLKNIDLEIPRDRLVVFTGVSGSGKSSLAFDTIYAEGQRRYVESLSAYARQFLGQMDKPDVDAIEGLSPAISIDQKTTSRNPRSTVGTVTEIYDYLRLLYARVGRPHCPRCGQPIAQQTIDQMVDSLMQMQEGTRIQVLAPLVRGRKGEHQKVFEQIRRGGYVRMRVDGQVMDVSDEPPRLDKNRKHTIEVVVDRLVIRPDIQRRLADSLETAATLSGGLVTIDVVGGEELLFSQNFACPDCGVSIDEPQPRNFSFNSPFGACPACTGLGFLTEFDPDLILDPSRSLDDGALIPWANSSHQWFLHQVDAVCRQLGIRKDVPLNQQDPRFQEILLYGLPDQKVRFEYENMYGQRKWHEVVYEGAIRQLERMHRETSSEAIREHLAEFMTSRPCPACGGARLKPESLAVKVGGLSIAELTALDVVQLRDFLKNLDLTEKERAIGAQILKEIDARLGFLINVGLDYLTLNRAAGTLSGGEAQRIRLATQIGSHLVGVLYILDEPSIGLHQRDNAKLIETLKRLRDLGNTLIVVEHDEDTILAADWVVDIGPGAGEGGGRIVASGPVEKILNTPESITGAYLSGRRQIPIPERRRQPNGKWLVVHGAAEHNLKDITVRIPLGTFTVVTGVSGSGKSTLVNEILYKRLAADLNRARTKPGKHRSVEGLEHLDKVIEIDQSPIGRTPRSNPATYTGVFDLIRELMAQTPEAKMRGYKAGRFSFNVRGGRCEACKGDGIIKIEMHFLPDVYVPCEVCKGARYNRETLEVHYKGKTIADILDMTVDEAVEFFRPLPRIYRKMQTLQDVGLGYIRLGQPATTLSGGEAQRVKLATELSRRATGRTIYILDEPTTGLHTADVHRLLDVLQRLVDAGNTVLVIEHNLDVIKQADWIIDLGPEGGDRGGRVVAEGTPEEVCENPGSYTGIFLKRHMERQRAVAPVSAAAGTD
ncbi:excinuclease ABC subunit UvrA [Symbiobacterium thermophilum]|uniref:UvrABC system protein A n=1 Tax=Symbiobacterium thermophilum (strain DSM 24528 / JCM 14929 / IAM 14863 / T) TaxID=292459 RepID=Q67T41_SYMTH|nr:excinuclease ABC subunit UvrA [Symbiobacterium thermophilum]BAD39152.1 excinuclease ABC subunit A [Symbiobacterium thermophilum IAM 14863]